jgi:hypothetical protein
LCDDSDAQTIHISFIDVFFYTELTPQVYLITRMLNVNRPNNDLSVDTDDLLCCYSTQIELPGCV